MNVKDEAWSQEIEIVTSVSCSIFGVKYTKRILELTNIQYNYINWIFNETITIIYFIVMVYSYSLSVCSNTRKDMSAPQKNCVFEQGLLNSEEFSPSLRNFVYGGFLFTLTQFIFHLTSL